MLNRPSAQRRHRSRSSRALAVALAITVTVALAAILALGPSPPPADASGVIDITAGSSYSCAMLSSGEVHCWGRNSEGQLGNGGACDPCPTPVPVSGITGASVLGGGSAAACAVEQGGLMCWGANSNGQLGDGTLESRSSPVAVCPDVVCLGLLGGVTQVDGGLTHTCAVVLERAICWGNNARDQLGRDVDCGTRCPIPAAVSGLSSGVVAIAAGSNHTCALISDGRLKCWGDNDHGQLGDGTLVRRPTPVDVCAGGPLGCATPLDGVTDIAAGGDHTCAVIDGGDVRCWGTNGHASITSDRICSPDCTTPAQVCLAYTEPPAVPGCLEPLTNASALVAGSDFQCATVDERVLCWGDHDVGQLGVGERCAAFVCTDPSEVCADVACAASLTGVTTITAGAAHACAVASGTLRCWGRANSGQLGHGVKPEPSCQCRTTPVDVASLPSSPKVTPAVSATWTRTPARTLTPIRTPTPPATKPCGDVNDDALVSAVDALLILQYSAALLPSLPNAAGADVNRDGTVTSIDASIVLQYTAARLATLHCAPPP